MIRRPPRSTLFPYTTLFRSKRIYRLPGSMPELTVFNSVLNNLANNIALLTIACQRASDKQSFIADQINKVARTNREDRKSTRLNSSHANISYAVFCLKKKK